MLRIRLRRVGKKKQPMYRIVVADSRAPRDGDFVESIGYYHPLDDPSTIVLDSDRARLWLDRGAQPSERVSKLLAIQGVADLPPKLKARIELGNQRAKDAETEKAKRKAEAPAEEAPAAEAAAEEEQPEASAEAPAEEAPAEAATEKEQPEASAEAPAEEAPAVEVATEKEQPQASAEAPEEEAPAAEAAAEEEQPQASAEATAGEASPDKQEKSEA